MAKLIKSLLSGSSGKIGGFVVVNLGGIEIIRALPKKRSGSSPKQLLVQQRMKSVYEFLAGYDTYARKFFGEKIGVRSSYNFAMTNVLKAFKIDYENNKIIPAYDEIQFSSGNLLPPISTQLTASVSGSFTLTWFDNSAGHIERETDQLQILYCVDGEKKPVFTENVAHRNDAAFTMNIPPNLPGKTLHVWMAFRTMTHTEVSISTYVSSIILI